MLAGFTQQPGDTVDGETQGFLVAAQKGRVCYQSGHYKKALTHYEDALRRKHRTIQTEPSKTQDVFADALHKIGCIHAMKGYREPSKSIQAFEYCLDLQKTRFGPKSYPVAAIMYKLAEAWDSVGENQVAVDILSEALAILLTTSPESQETADTWVALSRQLKVLGNEEDALASLKEATRLYELLENQSSQETA
jgi:tetratricopeptide (TPR) repeat protein